MSKKKEKRRVAVIDCETDPFLYGRKPEPFAWGFFDGDIYLKFWDCNGVSCTDLLLDYLSNLNESLIIYAHNGGKFDFLYLLEKGALTNPALIIHGRITKCGLLGLHELRDSYAAIPIPLKAFDKDDIDYSKMERAIRYNHKAEIDKYLKKDCTSLHELISKFISRFGTKLTIGATAISELEKLHPVIRLDINHDVIFRPFYFGGRVECFKSGILHGKWKIYDVNSMYPKAMRDYKHPLGDKYISLVGESANKRFDYVSGEIKGFGGMYFAHIICDNFGALPARPLDKKGGLDFNIPRGEFFVCSHEIKIALKLKLIKIHEVLSVYIPQGWQSFDKYVDIYSAEKVAMKKCGDKANETFAKLLLNSAYGKYGTNPMDFKEYFFLDCKNNDCIAEFDDWILINPKAELLEDSGNFEIWQCPAPNEKGFFDVAVAASITSAARSILLDAIYNAQNPIYCDTDSLICEELNGVELHDSKLGAWKFEGRGDTAYIAGKKLYAIELEDGSYKMASKGAKLKPSDIISICQGEIVEWKNDAPNMKLSGETKFISRKIKKIA